MEPCPRHRASGRQFLQLTVAGSAQEGPAVPEETQGTLPPQTRTVALRDCMSFKKPTSTRNILLFSCHTVSC